MRPSRADWKKLEEFLSITFQQLYLGQDSELPLVREPPFEFRIFNAITGCGLNIRKYGPVCSLSTLAATDISMEGVLAQVMARFSQYWDEFLQADGSFVVCVAP